MDGMSEFFLVWLAAVHRETINGDLTGSKAHNFMRETWQCHACAK
jgi:hypothetical protein